MTGYLNSFDDLSVKASSLRGLDIGEMINDEIVNYSVLYDIARRGDVVGLNMSFSNTYLFPIGVEKGCGAKRVRKWLQRITSNKPSYVFIPVHNINYSHWKLLIMDQRRTRILLLDSIKNCMKDEDVKFVYFLFNL
jgi:Ulp1 family protease